MNEKVLLRYDFVIIILSQCALMRSDSWGTVSPSYLEELRGDQPLRDFLQLSISPFAYPNRIKQAEHESVLLDNGGDTHASAKDKIQKKHFGFENGDRSISVIAFVGRITSQKVERRR